MTPLILNFNSYQFCLLLNIMRQRNYFQSKYYSLNSSKNLYRFQLVNAVHRQIIVKVNLATKLICTFQ